MAIAKGLQPREIEKELPQAVSQEAAVMEAFRAASELEPYFEQYREKIAAELKEGI